MAFLTAEWREVVMLNWQVPGELLRPSVPAGTELDLGDGRAYVSLVGFCFLNTRILKLPVPLHVNFEEVNLRFYVRRVVGDEVRRGVVFIKEIVPRRCIALVARRLYNENYVALLMSHHIECNAGRRHIRYNWIVGGRTNCIGVRADAAYGPLPSNSHEEFIAEHYWGYCRQRDGRTLEYRVHHPRWQIATVSEPILDCDGVLNYGHPLGELLASPPDSALLADGSQVSVGFGQRF